MNKLNPLSPIPVADWDLAWCLRLNRYSAHSAIAIFFKHISRLGNGRFWYSLIALIAVVEGLPVLPVLSQILLTAGAGVLIYKALKQRTLRPRPYQVHQAVVLGERPLDHFSFPSGHTLHAVLFTVMLGYHFPALLPLLLVFTPLVALSRMVLGLHYPTDVLAGAVIGGGLGAMGLWVF